MLVAQDKFDDGCCFLIVRGRSVGHRHHQVARNVYCKHLNHKNFSPHTYFPSLRRANPSNCDFIFSGSGLLISKLTKQLPNPSRAVQR